MGSIAILAAGIALPYGPAAAADNSEEVARNVEVLVHAGNIVEARAKLAQLIGTPPLSEKIADYKALLAPVDGPFSHQRRLDLAQGLPDLSDLEQRALYWFATLKPIETSDGACRVDAPASLLHFSAANGFAPSQVLIGTMLDSGAGCWSQDNEAAVYWFSEAAEQGNSDAQVSLAVALALGRGVRQDDAGALQLLLESAEEENARAQFLVGIRFLEGNGVRKNQRKAIGWLTSAAEQGFIPAQSALGQLLWDRAITDNEYQEARQWLTEAAESGYVEAQYQLGLTYTSGIDGEFWRFADAVKWLEKAAMGGVPEAQASLGLRYWNGDHRTNTMEADPEQAVVWFKLAAEKGNLLAQTYLGYALAKGTGVPEDGPAAVAWWRMAAEQDYARAEEALGWAYEQGVGVAQDLAQSRYWYQRAKAHGSRGAQDALTGANFQRLADEERAFATFAGVVAALVVLGVEEKRARRAEIQDFLAAGGEWKATYLCNTVYEDVWGSPQMVRKTYCRDQNGGVWVRNGLFDPCNGVTGWCDGLGLGPKPGLLK